MKHARKIWYLVVFMPYYIGKVFMANFQLAREVFWPRYRLHSATFEVKLKANNSFEALAITNLVSMTPGTLCLDIDQQKHTMLVHALYRKNLDAIKKDVEEMQTKIHKIFSD